MAPSFTKRPRYSNILRHATPTVLSCLGAIAALLPIGAKAEAPQLDSKQPITVDALAGDYEYARDHLHIKHVHITQGPLSVSADDAVGSALQFDDSHWQFTGHVLFKSAEGSLDSERATVIFLHNQLVSIDAEGSPSHFNGTHAGKSVHGAAEHIIYEPQNGTVKLRGDATLNDGDNEIKGELLSYNFNERHLQAGPLDTKPSDTKVTEPKNSRITITITPKANTGNPINPSGPSEPLSEPKP